MIRAIQHSVQRGERLFAGPCRLARRVLDHARATALAGLLLAAGASGVWPEQAGPQGGMSNQQELATNADMETGQPGVPSTGWVPESYGELVGSVVWDNKTAHAGKASLRLECPAFRGGAVQAYLPINPLKSGHVYTLRAWMRAQGIAVPVELLVRDIGPPRIVWLKTVVYLHTSALVTDQWRPVVVTGKANADGNKVGIFVSFQSPGTLWVDDVSLKEGEHPVETPVQEIPVVKGNYVQNSGFELGMQGWSMPDAIAIEDGGVGGSKFAHYLGKVPYGLEGRPVRLKPGQRYTFSAYLRDPGAGATATLSLCEVGGGESYAKQFLLSTEWQRYSFSFTPRCGQTGLYYLNSTWGFVDNVQIEEGDLTDYAPAHPVEAGFDLPRSERFPAVGAEVRFKVLSARSPGAKAHRAILVATNFFGDELLRRKIATNKPQQEVSVEFDQPGFVSLALLDEGTKPPAVLDEAQLCVTHGMDTGLSGDPFFGAHGTEGKPGEYHAITALAKGGARVWRLHDLPSYTQWFLVEPEKGKFTWYDEPIDAMRARGIRVLGVFCRTAPWAGRDPGGEPVGREAWPPRDWDEFGNYVYRTVEHYKAKIKHWEVWNEPWGRGFWAGTPEEYAKLLEVAWTQAKRADPECVIVGGCFWPLMPEFTDRVLATGAIKFMDAVSYHHYCEPEAMARGEVRSWYEHMRQRIDAAGGRTLPIWNTEGGTACPSYYWWFERREQAKAAAETVAKDLIESKSVGVEAFFYYHAWQELGAPRMFHGLTGGWYTHPLLEYDGSPKPIYGSYAAAAHFLTGGKPAGSVEKDTYRIYAFQRQEEAILALWARGALLKPNVLKVDLGPQARLFDMMGVSQPVTREGSASVLELRTAPCYVSVRDISAEELLRRLSATISGGQ